MMNNESVGIHVAGHPGTWYVIDETIIEGKHLFLLEHEIYGEDAPSIIVDEDCNIIQFLIRITDQSEAPCKFYYAVITKEQLDKTCLALTISKADFK